MGNILTMIIYHENLILFKDISCFYKHAHKGPEVKLRQWRKNQYFKFEKTSDTKSDIKPTKRPRMSLDMFGEGYLSCQESKSGNIKRLLLRFVVEKDNGKICVSCLLADTEKRSDEFVWLVTNGHVMQGVPRSERVHSLTLTPDERLLSLHVVPW